MRRQPVISFVVIAFAWTWAYVIFFLIVFPILDNPVRRLPPVPLLVAILIIAVVVIVATRGRLGYSGAKMPPSVAPAYSTP